MEFHICNQFFYLKLSLLLIFTPFSMYDHSFTVFFAGSSSFPFLKNWCSAGFQVLYASPLCYLCAFWLQYYPHAGNSPIYISNFSVPRRLEFLNYTVKIMWKSRVMWILVILKNISEVNFETDVRSSDTSFSLLHSCAHPYFELFFSFILFVILRSCKWTSLGVCLGWVDPT